VARKPDLAKRAEIAARAFEVIRARGVHRTSMSDIAAALEIKRPTLYWYFKDLGEVFDAVVDADRKRLEAFVLGRLTDVAHPLDVLGELVRAHLDYYEGRRDVIIALFQLWAVGESHQPSRMLERGRKFVRAVRVRLIDLVQKGIDDGLVASCDPEQLVDLVLAVSDGAMMQRVTMDTDAAVLVDGLVKHVLAPLRAAEVKAA